MDNLGWKYCKCQSLKKYILNFLNGVKKKEQDVVHTIQKLSLNKETNV